MLVLSLVRLAWRLVNPVPPLPAGMSAGFKTVAHVTHYLLYALMILVPLLGWGLVSASRTAVPTLFFGLFAWPNFGFIQDMPRAQKIAAGHVLGAGHEWLGYVLLFLALGHMAAALYHHFGAAIRCCAGCSPGPSYDAHHARRAYICRLGLCFGVPAFAADWTVDAAHSKLGFSLPWGNEPYAASFRKWTAEIGFDPADLAHAHVTASIDTASLDSGDSDTDESITGEKGFDSGHFAAAKSRPGVSAMWPRTNMKRTAR